MPADVAEIDHVFVLRFWREERCATTGAPRWRARISDIHTGRQLHANGLDAAFNVVKSLLPKSDAAAGPS